MRNATLREWLSDEHFDWNAGVIVCQVEQDKPAEQIDHYHPILDQEFDVGYGGPDAPPFVAHDKEFVYFADVYDGAQSIVKMAKDARFYIGSRDIPLPGGY